MNDRYVPAKALKELKWISVDLDGTLAEKKNWVSTDGIGEPLPGAKEAMWELKKHGFKVVVYTARGFSAITAIENWLIDHEIPFDRIECGKLLSRLHIDDKAFRYSGNWGSDLSEILKILKV